MAVANELMKRTQTRALSTRNRRERYDVRVHANSSAELFCAPFRKYFFDDGSSHKLNIVRSSDLHPVVSEGDTVNDAHAGKVSGPTP